MESNNSRLIILIISILAALTLIVIVLFNLNKENKFELPSQMPLSDIHYILASETVDGISNTMEIRNLSDNLRKNINSFDEIINILSYLNNDTSFYSEIANKPIYISTYKSGGWMMLIKHRHAPKAISGYSMGVKDGFFFINPENLSHIINAEVDNAILSTKEKNEISKIILSHDYHSDIYIIEKLNNNEPAAWVCHDFYFLNKLQITSFYSNFDILTRMIKDNPSNIIRSFQNCGAEYRFSNQNNSSSSFMEIDFSKLTIQPTEYVKIEETKQNKPSEKNKKEDDEKVTDKKLESKAEKTIHPKAIFTPTKTIIAGPFFVKNHKDNGVFVQTSDNILHYRDNNGKEKWDINIDSKIIGKITEVDWYDNGKIQYMFNTSTRLYIVDILGNSVKRFPLTLPVKVQNQITLLKNNTSNFNVYFNGTDNAFYCMTYKNDDFIVEKKNDNIGAVSEPYIIVYDKKTPYIIVKKDNKTMAMYRSNGTFVAKVDESALSNPSSVVYNNQLNSKGTFLTGDDNGNVLYISKTGSIDRTQMLAKPQPSIMYYESFASDEPNNFFFIYNKKIEAFSPQKKTLFSLDLQGRAPYKTSVDKFDNQIVFTIFSPSDKTANIVRYHKNGKHSNRSYKSKVMPSVDEKNVYLIDDNSLVKETME